MAEVPRYKSFLEKLQFYPNHGLVTKEEGVDALLKVLSLRETEGYFYHGLMRSSYKMYTTKLSMKALHALGRIELNSTSALFPVYHPGAFGRMARQRIDPAKGNGWDLQLKDWQRVKAIAGLVPPA